MRDFILDPWDPKNKGWCLTSDGLYKTTNLDATSPTWSLVISRATMFAVNALYQDFLSDGPLKFRSSIVDANLIYWLFNTHVNAPGPNDRRLVVLHSHDGGTTLHDGGYFTQDYGEGGSLFNSDHSASVIFVGATTVLFKSTDSGHTWNSLSGYTIDQAASLDVAYQNNSSDQVLLAGGGNTTPRLWRSSNGGTSWTDVRPTYNSVLWGAGVGHNTIQFYTADRNIVYAFLEDAAGGGNDEQNNKALFKSTDGGATWSFVKNFAAGGHYFNIGLWPYNSDKLFALSRAEGGPITTGIWYSSDGGTTMQSKLGDWTTVMGVDFVLSRSAGRHMIVPVWVE